MSRITQASPQEESLVIGVIVYEGDRMTPYDLRTIMHIDDSTIFRAPTNSDLIDFMKSHKGKKMELYYN